MKEVESEKLHDIRGEKFGKHENKILQQKKKLYLLF